MGGFIIMKNSSKKCTFFVSMLLTTSLLFSGCSPIYTPYDVVKGLQYLLSTDDTEEASVQPVEMENHVEEDDENQEEEITIETVDSTEVLSQTIMIYMVGSDLESCNGSASMDLQEMMNASVDTDVNNVVVYAGGASEWLIPEIDSKYNTTLLLDNGEFTVINETASVNMGEPDTLSNFINDCFENYDTDLYSLILWDHGAGPVVGFGIDENYTDILDLPELEKALSSSVGTSGKKLEWIGFDACLMSSLEVADIMEPYANYLIASQETEPGWGWNYDFLSSLSKPGMNGVNLSKEIIDSYMNFGESAFEQYPNCYSDLTLSCIDLNKYADVEELLNSSFKEQDKSLSVDTFPEMIRERGRLREFGSFSTDYNFSMVDCIQLLDTMSSSNSSASSTISAIEDMVIYEKNNMDNACGISICYPYLTEDDYQETCIALQEEMNFAPEYTKFLKNLYSISEGDALVEDWNIADAETSVSQTELTEANISSDGSDISLALTKEQQKNFASASYFILCNAYDAGIVSEENDPNARNSYIYVYQGKNVRLDKEGILHAYYANSVLYMHDKKEDKLSPIPLMVIDNQSSSKEKRYLSYCLLQYMTGDISDWKTATAELQIAVNSQYPDGIIRNAIYLDDNNEDNNTFNTPDKQLVDLSEYDFLSVAMQSRYPTRDANGTLLNYLEWDTSGWYLGFDQEIETADLKVVPLQNPENYYCMFVIRDSQGNETVSELIPLG